MEIVRIRREDLLTFSSSRDQLTAYDQAMLELTRQLEDLRSNMEVIEQRHDLSAKLSKDIDEQWQGLRAKLSKDIDRQWQSLGTRLSEGIDAVSRQAELVAFKPGYEELALMAIRAKPAWGELVTSPTAGYAFAAMATLREAMERGPFAAKTIAALHSQLGNWFGVSLSAELFDQQKRQDVYLRTGLDPRLVDLEQQTFDVLLGATELRPTVPSPEESKDLNESADLNEDPTAELCKELLVEVEGDYQVEGLEQAVEDYRFLYSFESQLRSFVTDVLSKIAGPDWVKQRVPPDCLAGWRDRRAKDQRARPLPTYADLGDWSKIIQRKDNWPLFKPFFKRPSFVEESFIRLIPLRNDLAHTRPLTKADRLVFYVEIYQLKTAIRKPQVEDDD